MFYVNGLYVVNSASRDLSLARAIFWSSIMPSCSLVEGIMKKPSSSSSSLSITGFAGLGAFPMGLGAMPVGFGMLSLEEEGADALSNGAEEGDCPGEGLGTDVVRAVPRVFAVVVVVVPASILFFFFFFFVFLTFQNLKKDKNKNYFLFFRYRWKKKIPTSNQKGILFF